MSTAAISSDSLPSKPGRPARRYWLEILNDHANRVIPKGASAAVEEVGCLHNATFPDLHRKLLHCEIEHVRGSSKGTTEKYLLRANLKPDGKLHLTFESKLALYRGSEETYPGSNSDTVVRIKGRVVGRYVPVEIFDTATEGLTNV